VKGDLGDLVKEVTGDLLKGLSLELVDVAVIREKGRTLLRIAVDKGGGVTLDDCAQASEMVGQVLERENVIHGPYVLEVMSPGLDRPIRRPEDFSRSIGKRIKVKLLQPLEGKSSFSGILRDAGVESMVLDLGDELLELSYKSVSTARLDPEFPW
jgi:ribosome maturation factor RimP